MDSLHRLKVNQGPKLRENERDRFNMYLYNNQQVGKTEIETNYFGLFSEANLGQVMSEVALKEFKSEGIIDYEIKSPGGTFAGQDSSIKIRILKEIVL